MEKYILSASSDQEIQPIGTLEFGTPRSQKKMWCGLPTERIPSKILPDCSPSMLKAATFYNTEAGIFHLYGLQMFLSDTFDGSATR
ncbi:hypothetical protein LINGRAHAP2_LOCUS32230 [Linum grandiflorum]